MHDPMHVVLDILHPWPQRRARRRPAHPNPRRRHRQIGPLNLRAREFSCAHCDAGRVTDPPPSYHSDYLPGEACPDCAGRGFLLTPHRRRPYLSWHFWRFGEREWYFPAVVTLWHVDPEADGTDSSCRNRYRRRWVEARADGDGLAEWFWSWAMRRYDLWHFHHWRVQIRPLEAARRWLLTRCAHCGGRFPYGYAPISVSWDSPQRSFRERWTQGESGLYHHDCADRVRQPDRPEDVAA